VQCASLCSIVTGMLSRHLKVDDRPNKSDLDLGGGDDDFTGSREKAGAVAESGLWAGTYV